MILDTTSVLHKVPLLINNEEIQFLFQGSLDKMKDTTIVITQKQFEVSIEQSCPSFIKSTSYVKIISEIQERNKIDFSNRNEKNGVSYYTFERQKILTLRCNSKYIHMPILPNSVVRKIGKTNIVVIPYNG